MSTASGICLRSGDTFETIYCHHDGYPEHMLPILRGNYNSFELASKLISFGDASSIAPKLEAAEGESKKDVCVFYHRDRGEDWISCRSCCYLRTELFKQTAFEFVYIFEDGQWNAYAGGKLLHC